MSVINQFLQQGDRKNTPKHVSHFVFPYPKYPGTETLQQSLKIKLTSPMLFIVLPVFYTHTSFCLLSSPPRRAYSLKAITGNTSTDTIFRLNKSFLFWNKTYVLGDKVRENAVSESIFLPTLPCFGVVCVCITVCLCPHCLGKLLYHDGSCCHDGRQRRKFCPNVL